MATNGLRGWELRSDTKTRISGPVVQPPLDDVSASPRWLEALRNEHGYVAVTIGLDVWAASWAVLFAQWWTNGPVYERNVALCSWIFVPVVVAFLGSQSMYRRKLNQSVFDDLGPAQTAIALATLVTLTLMLILVPPLQPGDVVVPYVRPSEIMVRLWLWAVVMILAVRLIRSLIERHLRRTHDFGAPALIIGSGPIAHQLLVRMRQVPDYGLRPVGILDVDRPIDPDLFDLPYLGTTDDLERAVAMTGAVKLIIAPCAVPDEQLARTAHRAQELGMRVRVVPRLMDAVGVGARVEHLGGVPLLVLNPVNPKGWQFALKHASDRVIAAVGLLLISPLLIALAILVKTSSPGPVFFRQPRIGRDGKVFDCLKFRSMRPIEPADARFEPSSGAAPGGVEGDDRRTRIGKIMRKTSFDELPQLLNVVRGEMSLVGPRPERPEFVELFELQVRRYGDRHRVKAGITGWSQVHGLRGQTSIADRAEFDNYYIENWSLQLDLKILLLTVFAVLRGADE